MAPFHRFVHLRRRTRAALVALLLAAGFVVAGPALSASAAKPVAVIRPATMQSSVSADVLPTTQVDGVVWSIAASSTVAYAGGQFTKARPSGAAAGVNTVSRNNLLAFDITTGALITSFAPDLNAQVKTVALSPDGSRLYVGGSFTKANGVTRNRIAAYNTATGALVTEFSPSMQYTVNTIAVTNTAVYVGGEFTSANGIARSRLAAFSPTNGALLGWAPSSDGTVQAMVASDDGSQIVIGGSFTKIGGADAYGMAALNATTGALNPWAVGSVVRNAGPNSAILSLSTANGVVYGGGYKFGSGGNFEGAFAASMNGGTLLWLEDCHGDTYDTFPLGDAVFVASHEHACNNVGSFPERSPRAFQRATAFTKAATTNKVTHNYLSGYNSFVGKTAPTAVGWFPYLEIGSYTGKSQAAWALGGNANYLVMGGEFPTVNGVAQQGLARFAVRTIAPNKVKPALSGVGMGVAAVSLTAGQVRVGLPANYDMDDVSLTYRLYRDGSSTPLAATSAQATVLSTFWNRPGIALTDTGLANGSTHSYVVKVSDQWGNVQSSSTVSATVAGGTATSPYSAKVGGLKATTYLRLGEAAGTTAYDWGGGTDAFAGTGVTRGVAGAVAGNTAVTLSGTSSGTVQLAGKNYGPQRFSVQAWVKTNTTTGGQILEFSGDGYVDRSLYMTNSGQLSFVVYDDAYDAVTSAAGFNDNQWHLVTGTLDSSGQKIYVDGTLRASRTDVTAAQYQYGSWRVGGEKTAGYPGTIGSVNFKGSVDEVAIYPSALTAANVADLYAARSQAAAAAAPAPAPQQAPAAKQPATTATPQPAPAVVESTAVPETPGAEGSAAVTIEGSPVASPQASPAASPAAVATGEPAATVSTTASPAAP